MFNLYFTASFYRFFSLFSYFPPFLLRQLIHKAMRLRETMVSFWLKQETKHKIEWVRTSSILMAFQTFLFRVR